MTDARTATCRPSCATRRSTTASSARRGRAPAPNELVIRIGACGICASDCKCWSGAKMFWGGNGQPPWVKAPVIPGHEFFGYVEELGDGRGRAFRRCASASASSPSRSCRASSCRYCRSGKYWMCEVHNIFGFQRDVADGGMAQFMRIPPTRARAPDSAESLSLEDAAIIEPLACAIHAVNRGDIQLDDVVVIAGAGPDRPDDGAGGAAEDAAQARRHRPGAAAARARHAATAPT